jgi:tyrosyl-tRNA synthetase
MYISLFCGLLAYLFLFHSLWQALGIIVSVRIFIFLSEYVVEKNTVNRLYKLHSFAFKQELGPYGIRLINRAETNYSLKKSLAEVFTPNIHTLQKNVSQLEIMDTLFKAGMQPDADAYQLHDCKLKYGKFRLDKLK